VNTAKNRKVVGAILGLAVAALVTDKLVLGGGATPSLAADGVLDRTLPGAMAPAAGKDVLGDAPGTLSVTAQLVSMQKRLKLGETTEITDAFAPPEALADMLEHEQERQKLIERQSKAAEQAIRLREQLRLTATRTTGTSAAMINGTLFALGAEVPGTGFRVKEIDREGVLLEDTLTHATVRLELNPDTASRGYRSPQTNSPQ